jgi:hypothetical protein
VQCRFPGLIHAQIDQPKAGRTGNLEANPQKLFFKERTTATAWAVLFLYEPTRVLEPVKFSEALNRLNAAAGPLIALLFSIR